MNKTTAPNDPPYKRGGDDQRLQTDVHIVSKPPAPSDGGPIYRFFGASRSCEPAGWLALLLMKAGDIETNPGPTATHKQV